MTQEELAFHVSLDMLLKDDMMVNGIKEEHSCSSNAVWEKWLNFRAQ